MALAQPRAAPSQASPTMAQLASLANVTDRSTCGSSQSAKGTSSQPSRLIANRATRPAASVGPGRPMPTRPARPSGSSRAMASAMATLTAPGTEGRGVATSSSASRVPAASKRPNLIAVPPRSTPINWGPAPSGGLAEAAAVIPGPGVAGTRRHAPTAPQKRNSSRSCVPHDPSVSTKVSRFRASEAL